MTDDLQRAFTHSNMQSSKPKRILPLSAEAIAQIHSSKHITSLQGVTFALLENCLDAGASRVNISVDWRRGNVTVDDNGIGIPLAEFDEDGGLGKLYCTSKRSLDGIQSSKTHGHSGTFLAELAAMSLLSISSVHTQTRSTAAVLTLHHGKVITRRLPDIVTHPGNVSRISGTNVSVRDLFGNMPVRIKQRAFAGQASYEDDKSWFELKRGVVALLLAWPKPCSVKLRDINADHKAMSIAGHQPGAPSALTVKSLHQLAGRNVSSDLRDALPLLFQSGFAPPDSRSKWVPLSASTSSISLKGVICLEPAPTKQSQFISLGITPCSATTPSNELYDVVSKTFSNSSFGACQESFDVAAGEIGRKRSATTPTGKQLQAKKGVDRFPMYCIQLKFKEISYASVPDVECLCDSSLKSAVEILEAALTTWLESNHFRPRKRRRRRNEEQESNPGLVGHLSDKPLAVGVDRADVTPRVDRRRNDLGLSTKPASQDMTFEPSLSINAADLSSLSKIRFGSTSDRPQSALHHTTRCEDDTEVPRARSAEPAQLSGTILPMTVKKQRRLQAVSIEAGELGGISREHDFASRLPKPAVAGSRNKEDTSSDCFGSINDDSLLEAEHAGRREKSKQAHVEIELNDCNTSWTDPVSKQVFRVNSRTGVVLPLIDEPESTRKLAAIDVTLSSKGKPLSLSRRSAMTGKDDAERPATADSTPWLPGFLKQWINPVFARQKEEAIPMASASGPGPLEFDVNGKCCSHIHLELQLSNNSTATTLTKTALRKAEVIAQVDTKFILCKMPATPPTSMPKEQRTLILIDQHAASERIMLENLLAEFCTPSDENPTSIQTTCLRNGTARAQPLVVEVSAKEVDLFAHYRTHFARWGVLYDTVSAERTGFAQGRDEMKESRIRVTHLPRPVAERCANFPSLAIDMLRSEVWALEDGSRKAAKDVQMPACGENGRDQPFWLSLLSAIPPSLLALLQSRSCRSAIMFNDVLSREQCVKLVEQLGECVFPFVCAHGRVSMVPLGNIGVASVDSGREVQRSEGQAMGSWLRSLGTM